MDRNQPESEGYPVNGMFTGINKPFTLFTQYTEKELDRSGGELL